MRNENQQRKKAKEKRIALYGYNNIDKKIEVIIHKKRSNLPKCPFDHTKLIHFKESKHQRYILCPRCNRKFMYAKGNESEIINGKYNLFYYEKRNKPQSKPKPSVPLDQDSVLIYGNSFDCIVPGHKTEQTRIDIPVKSFNRISPPTGIHAAYCPECKSYYILDHTYKMYEYARIMCHVYSKQEARRLFKGKKSTGADTRSILMEHGYSVSKAANLPASDRHRILCELIKTRILAPEEIESYLRTFIKQHETISQNREAVQKWQEDLEYVIRYSEEMYDRLNTYR